MYEWDPEGGFPNAVWSGTLTIDGPCVYLDVSHRDGRPVRDGVTLLSFVRLPTVLTRFDAAGELWVGEHGPMSTGDEVVLVGSEGWRQSWNQPGEDIHVFEFVWANPADSSAGQIPVCSAHVSFYAASMSPADSGEGQLIDTEARTYLAGLYRLFAFEVGVEAVGVRG